MSTWYVVGAYWTQRAISCLYSGGTLFPVLFRWDARNRLDTSTLALDDDDFRSWLDEEAF